LIKNSGTGHGHDFFGHGHGHVHDFFGHGHGHGHVHDFSGTGSGTIFSGTFTIFIAAFKIYIIMEIIAHRGFSKKAPENTLSSVSLAFQNPVDYVEIDVHLSRDGIPVVIHDAVLGRTAPEANSQRITEMTLDRIQKLDVGSWFDASFKGEKIPTLEDILELDFGNSGLMIEIKKGHSPIKPLVTAVGKVVRNALKKHPEKKILIGSFSFQVLKEMQLQFPALPLIGIIEDFNHLADVNSIVFSRLALWHKLLTPSLLKTLQNKNTKVWTFTVDDPLAAKSLHEMGVHGIITNDPESISRAFNSQHYGTL
jgi:glycerophosphoryl diester phosphodiesterase